MLRRSTGLLRTLQKQESNFTHQQPIYQTRLFPGRRTQSRPYLGRLPIFPRKIRECSDLSSATFCSSAGTTSSKVGLVGWYLEMVKSRPIVTKSVTCALIYTAADLSSQVMKRKKNNFLNLWVLNFIVRNLISHFGLLKAMLCGNERFTFFIFILQRHGS